MWPKTISLHLLWSRQSRHIQFVGHRLDIPMESLQAHGMFDSDSYSCWTVSITQRLQYHLIKSNAVRQETAVHGGMTFAATEFLLFLL